MRHFRIFDNVGDFAAGQLKVQRNNHRAKAGKRHVTVNVFSGIAREQADILPRTDSLLVKIIAIVAILLLKTLVSDL